ncbi:DUF2089 family protein [Candidatus Bipolaricaulota bacterium]|nr:DUF2089 family protein [Candidatus Bipolaricaulota bacterium]
MSEKINGKCPVRGQNIRVTELECPSCHTQLSGQLNLGRFSRLNRGQLKADSNCRCH